MSDGSSRASAAMARTAAIFISSLMARAPTVERAAEDVGEAEHVVDLVREVRTAGADHGVGPRRPRDLRHDLRHRIGERQDQRLRRHAGQHFGLQHAGGRQAEEDVGAVDHVGQRARGGVLARRASFQRSISLGAAFRRRRRSDVGDPDVLAPGAERDQQVEAGERRRACARGDDLRRPRSSCRRGRARSARRRRR